MQDGTLRFMSMGVILYILSPLLVVYSVLAAISNHGSEVIDWAFQVPNAISDTEYRAVTSTSVLSQNSIQLAAFGSLSSGPGNTTRILPAAAKDDEAEPQRGDNQFTEEIDRTVKMDKDGKFEIENISGDITVTTWNQSEARIKATKIARAYDKDEAAEALEQVQVEIDARSGDVYVHTDYPDNRGRRWGDNNFQVSVIYEITIPAQSSLRAKSVSGNLQVSDINGEVDVRSVSGTVLLSDISSRTRASSVSGNVEARNLNGESDLQSVSGNVQATLAVGDMEASSTSGRVELRDVTAERLFAKSVSGTIRFEGPIMKSGRYEIESMSGGIRMTIPEESGFDLRANTFSGSINSDLPITIQGNRSSRQGRNKRLDGTVNGGGANIELSTFSGSIDIRTR